MNVNKLSGMKLASCFIVLIALAACSSKDKYDVTNYYDVREQDKILTSIVTYLAPPPPYTQVKDRFNAEHVNYYSFAASKFAIEKYFIAPDGTHYFYIIRPASNLNEKRGVGGHFKMSDNHLTDFREEFVTPSLSEEDLRGRVAFLFDEMVKGDLEKYMKMESYVQWPNPISYYDTTTYEWKLNPEVEQPK